MPRGHRLRSRPLDLAFRSLRCLLGMQLIVQALRWAWKQPDGANTARRSLVDILKQSLRQRGRCSTMWMSHGDSVTTHAAVRALAHTPTRVSTEAVIADHRAIFTGVSSFHPEVIHSSGAMTADPQPSCTRSGLPPDWTQEAFTMILARLSHDDTRV